MLTDNVGVAKGTFYHYFESKEDLLTQWVFHEMRQPIEQQRQIAEHNELNALNKLNKIFEHSHNWKIQHLDIVLPLMRVLYEDHNLRLRHEMAAQSRQLLTPIFEIIIEQGVKEGVFDTEYASEIAQKLPGISQLFSEDLVRILLRHFDQRDVSLEEAHLKLRVWRDVMERMLGAPKHSLVFIKEGLMNEYFSYLEEQQTITN